MQRNSARLLSNKQLEFVPDQPEKCRIVEGDHFVLVITQQNRKSFFRSDNRFAEEFLIDLNAVPDGSHTFQLPIPESKACYKAGFHMITFLDFAPKGNLTLEKQNGKVKGKVDLSLKNELQMEGTEKEGHFEMTFTVEN
ncbi:MAG: hypothetical protein H6581_10295 [Bacteroidia bacterium]|nr:hypothetical protein [Bacteroidia bacterium]